MKTLIKGAINQFRLFVQTIIAYGPWACQTGGSLAIGKYIVTLSAI